MDKISRQVGDGRSAGSIDWFHQAAGWQIALLVLAALLVLPMCRWSDAGPAGRFVMFARAWVREFAYLMKLRDDAFPGHNDKLIWAILLIVLAPVGTWLFQNYREAHWPEAKPTKGRADAFESDPTAGRPPR